MRHGRYETYREDPVTSWEWLVVLILVFIPVVGLIALLYFYFSRRTKASLRNFARVMLIFWLLYLLLLLAFLFFPAFKHKLQEQLERDLPVPYPGKFEPGRSEPEASKDYEGYRMFESKDGRYVYAIIVSIDGDEVTLKQSDGYVVTTSVSDFSEEDQEYLRGITNQE